MIYIICLAPTKISNQVIWVSTLKLNFLDLDLDFIGLVWPAFPLRPTDSEY